jgi:hypothetical protein
MCDVVLVFSAWFFFSFYFAGCLFCFVDVLESATFLSSFFSSVFGVGCGTCGSYFCFSSGCISFYILALCGAFYIYNMLFQKKL